MTTPTRFTSSFDFPDLVNSLQTFMRSTDDFRDTNFDGSAAKALLRVMSYNTHIQSIANGYLFNELSLDSATGENNVKAIASGVLGYMPQGKKAATYYADITVKVPPGQTGQPYILIDRSSKFFSAKDGVALNFVADTTYTAYLNDDGSSYDFYNVRLLQGNWVSNSFICQTSNNVESYRLPNLDIDIDFLNVAVTVPTSSNTLTAYKRIKSAFDMGPENNSYFLSLNKGGYYTLEFGDGRLARRLNYGDVILVDSLQTLGELGNNASIVNAVGSIGGYFDIEVSGSQEFSYGGAESEDMETTRKAAPLSFSAQGSAVSSGDFVALTKELFSEAESVASWGGEQDDPPKYGYQLVAVKPKNSTTLGDIQKKELAAILQERCIGSISPIIVDPDYTYINLKTNVVYTKNKTLLSEQSLRVKVTQSLQTFSSAKMEFFGGDYLHTNTTTFITLIDPSFTGNITTVSYVKKFTPALNVPNTQTFKFGDAIKPSSVVFTNFKIIDSVYGSWDFSLVDDGVGNIKLKRTNPVLDTDFYFYPETIGSVDYSAGVVNLTKFNPTSIIGAEGLVFCEVVPSSPDPSLLSSRSSIIALDKITVTFTMR